MAKHLLKEHFGNEHKITAAYMEKALSWPAVKPEDVKSLQAYARFLRECCNVMQDVQYMTELDMPSNMRSVILKLPYKLRKKWPVKFALPVKFWKETNVEHNSLTLSHS